MAQSETSLLIGCIITHLVGLIFFSISVRLIYKEYKKRQAYKPSLELYVPRNVRLAANGVYFCCSFVVLGMWGLATPYLCDALKLEMPNELAYIWIRIFLVYFQSTRLKNILGYRGNVGYGSSSSSSSVGGPVSYSKWTFITINAYLAMLAVLSIFVAIIFKEQMKYPGIEYYYKGCIQVINDLRLLLIAVTSLLVFFIDWVVIGLFFYKLNQINKLVEPIPYVSETLKNILREFLGLALSMEMFTLVSVVINTVITDQTWLTNLSTAIDVIWTIMAVRFMFQHNADEFTQFKKQLSKYCVKWCIFKYCCCVCYCDKTTDVWAGVNSNTATSTPNAGTPQYNGHDTNTTNSVNSDNHTGDNSNNKNNNNSSGQTASSGPGSPPTNTVSPYPMSSSENHESGQSGSRAEAGAGGSTGMKPFQLQTRNNNIEDTVISGTVKSNDNTATDHDYHRQPNEDSVL